MYIWVIYNFYEDAEVSNAGVPCLSVFFVSITSSLLGGGDAWRNVGTHGVIKPDPSVSKILELIWPNLTRLG